MSWYYRYETKGIQSWILSSNKLRDLAGGSVLVESLTQAARDQARALKAEIVQATSGAMTAIFPDRESLQKFASEWPMQTAYRAPGLQMIQAWVEASRGLPELFQKLASQRNDVSLLDMELNPWVLRCGRSGLPAVPKPKDISSSARQTSVDLVTMAKERAREIGYRELSDVTGGRLWMDFEEKLEYWPEGPVAVIHADGSGIGKRLMGMGSDIGKLQAFSKAMKAAVAVAIQHAVGTLGAAGEKLNARPVVAAGDDLTYIVRAQQARKFAETWLGAFEAETERLKGDLGGARLHGGASIIIVNRSYPFANAYELAEKLCKAAKDAIKKQQRACSVLAFRRVTTSLVDDNDLGSAAWVVDGHEAQPLSRLVSAVRDLPRGTLRTWLDHFQRPQGAATASQLWARAEEVAKDGKWEHFAKALQGVGADPNTGKFLAVPTGSAAVPLGQKESCTPVSDALTLRFVESLEV